VTGPVAVVGGAGRTGLAVRAGLAARGVSSYAVGRAERSDLTGALAQADRLYLIAPNLHPDEPTYVAETLAAARSAGIGRVAYHSVASPYAPAMPHHLGKARSEDLVRTSGLAWTILQPGAYLQNLDLTSTLRLPYRADARFGFLDLADLGAAAATVLLDDGHEGATYELASRVASVAELAAEAGAEVVVERPTGEPADREATWLRAMFAYYDAHGLPVGTLPLRALLGG
jgi:uncharacterized protein YbjT (DUF2867 family)